MNYTIDTEVLLKFYFGEDGADEIEKYLTESREKKINLYINVINLTEFYYIIYRMSPKLAEERITDINAFNIKVVYVDNDSIWKKAALIKGKYSLSLADAYSVSTALFTKSTLLIGNDSKFDAIEEVKKIRI